MSTTTFDRAALKEILTRNLGLDDESIEASWAATLTELGIDSIGVLELQTVAKDRHAVSLPDGIGELSLERIVDLAVDGTKGNH